MRRLSLSRWRWPWQRTVGVDLGARGGNGALTVAAPLPPGFWTKVKVHREQATVAFRHEVLVELHGASGESWTYSSLASVNALQADTLRVGTIGVTAEDEDEDEKPEAYHVHVSMPLRAGEAVHAASVAVFFDYYLSEQFRLKVDAMALATVESARAGSRWTVDGELHVSQRRPQLFATDRVVTPAMLPANRPLVVDDVAVPALVGRYRNRTVSVDYARQYSHWTGGETGTFEIEATVRVPHDYIYYVPGFWETIKFGWMQFLAVFIVLWYILRVVRAYTFQQQVVETKVVWDTTPKLKPF